ncbi:MAG: aminotransferase class V-fold PLP-dependent enzyme [Deltaproteobacteria bacterium]|jgi:cysteine desulfurase|nr:aminotransferase class V-fold PLP-dependent enzyme [Deltaproteobacteria bacterium]
MNPMPAPLVYFDNNATTRVAPEVREAMQPFLQNEYANPSSLYSFAHFSQDALLIAHEQVAALLGAKAGEIIMTSCGTESDSTAIYSALESLPKKKTFITTPVEHSAVLAVAERLETKGYNVLYLSVNSLGQIDLDELDSLITDDTALVSIMFANNETGTLYPVAEAGALCRKHGVLFHTDAVQALGKVPINLATLPVDYLSLSGHKIHAPKGIGALYVRQGVPFVPFMLGGHQEYNRRAGTQAVPMIVALGRACELARQNSAEENPRVQGLRDDLQTRLLAAIPESIILGDEQNRLPNTLNLAFKDVYSEDILLLLDQYNICASAGSACIADIHEPTHVLKAMQVGPEFANGAIRLSLSGYNTKEEVAFVGEKLPEVIQQLRLQKQAPNVGVASCLV